MVLKIGNGDKDVGENGAKSVDDELTVFAATLQDIAETMKANVRLARRSLQSSCNLLWEQSTCEHFASENTTRACALLTCALKDFECLVADLGKEAWNLEAVNSSDAFETDMVASEHHRVSEDTRVTDIGSSLQRVSEDTQVSGIDSSRLSHVATPWPFLESNRDDLPALPKHLDSEDSETSSGSGNMLPNAPNQPNQFNLLAFWEPLSPSFCCTHASEDEAKVAVPIPLRASWQIFDDDEVEKGTCSLSPHSPIRMFFDLIALVAVIYDLTTVPLYVFDFGRWKHARTLSLVVCIIWTVELPVSFFSSYHANGYVETRLKQIAKRNVFCGWFIPDFTILVVDWLFIIADDKLAINAPMFKALRVGRLTRIIRLARLLRLMRAVKLQGILAEMSGYVFSDRMTNTFQVAKLTGAIFFFCHVVGCGWYALSHEVAQQTGVHNWVRELDVKKESNVYRYLVSIRLVFAQFTPAPPPSLGAVKTHFYEELFNMTLLLIGFGLFSACTGSITANYVAMQKQNYRMAEEKHELRRFLKQHHVSLSVGNEIVTWDRQRPKQQLLQRDTEVKAIHSLPCSLLAKLRLEVYGFPISKHPLFYQLVSSNVATAKEFCMASVSQHHFTEGEAVCHLGETASMTFVRKSSVVQNSVPALAYKYTMTSTTPLYNTTSSLDFTDQEAHIGEGSWFCEVALWLAGNKTSPSGSRVWTHHATVVALRFCAIFQINTESFCHAISMHPRSTSNILSYAQLILEEAKSIPPCIELWPTQTEAMRMTELAFNYRSNMSSSGTRMRTFTMRSLGSQVT